MSVDLAEIRADLAAFADDDDDVIVERNGQCLFARGGTEIAFTLLVDDDERTIVDLDGEQMSYRRFLVHYLARLPMLAERILSKRQPVPAYVDSAGVLDSPSEDTRRDSALTLLQSESSVAPAFVSRVVFITADAGQGKTALLRQFQQEQARRFLDGESGYVFWHVDLQGRQLLRLSEALMGDLGELRVSGLWMPAIVRLLRHKALVLAIDGFDELAAEQGGSDALGALAVLVQQMDGHGTIVAASRRTFFDTDDYARRARLFSRVGAADCEFAQISLKPWGPPEARAYLRGVRVDTRAFDDGDEIYKTIVEELGSADHPMLTRPFLLAQVARGLLRYDMAPGEFIRGMDDPLRGVGAVIEAFVEREVAEKWKQKDTGEPFLNKEQHLRLLADVAEEMFRSQRSTIDLDVLETLMTLLFDEWEIEPVRRRQILQMVQMHVLLTRPDDGALDTRSFDHEEFRDWFMAYALKDRLVRLKLEGEAVSHDLLSIAHLPDATARYVCALIDRTPQVVADVIQGLTDLVRREWRPTYLQINAGTIIPFMLDGVAVPETLVIDGNLAYTSLVHEGKTITNVVFRGSSFVNVSLSHVVWDKVDLVECALGEISVDRTATYSNVRIIDCQIDAVRLVGEDGEETREYAPDRIRFVLEQLGIEMLETAQEVVAEAVTVPDGDVRKLVRRVLNVFRRTTFLPENVVQLRFRQDAGRVLDQVLPLMEEFRLIETRPWKGSGKQRAWGLIRTLEDIERADGDSSDGLHPFWVAVDEADAGRRH